MQRKWWHDKVAYQIYPKSFMDSNGDGIGDLKGIIGKLDYLKELGIDIIWLSPVYKSPFMDQGYDISDYYAIAEEFGTMEDFDRLLEGVKARGMYLIMDLVINHCSDQHEWFQKAIADPDGPYGNYFYFRKGIDGKEPSNLRSYFGGNVWEKVPGQEDLYYLHMYHKGQPDLNWNNPDTLADLYAMVNWWLDKGIAGFRIDAIMDIDKDLSFPAHYEPDGPDGMAFCKKLTIAGDHIGDRLKALKEATFDRYDAFTVGECFGMKEGELPNFIGENGYFSTAFDFGAQELMYQADCWAAVPPLSFEKWRDAVIAGQHASMPFGFRANIIENHDEPRGASRYLPPFAQCDQGVKMLGMCSLLLRGIPFIYQGQEIGMRNVAFDSMEDYNDTNSYAAYELSLQKGYSKEEALEGVRRFSRDNARTPMQWTSEVNAGFSTGKPWLPVNPNYKEINVEKQEKEADSVLAFYKELIAFRKEEDLREIFAYGDFAEDYLDCDHIFAFHRILGDRDLLVISNWSREDRQINLGQKKIQQVLLRNTDGFSYDADKNLLTLKSLAAITVEVK